MAPEEAPNHIKSIFNILLCYNISMTETASNNAAKPRGKPFLPGNTYGKGRPVGSQNKATLALAALIVGEGEDIVGTIISAAKNGDMSAAKALLDRLVPPRKSTPISANISPIAEAADLKPALLEVFNQMADGNLSTDECTQLTAIISNHAKLHEFIDLDTRLLELERQIGIAKTNKTSGDD
jgi:hypothetical protein